MKRKWKSLSALCLAAVLGLSMPVSTMRAAEENQDTPDVVEQEDVQDDSAAEDLAIGDSEPVVEQPLEEINVGAVPHRSTIIMIH